MEFFDILLIFVKIAHRWKRSQGDSQKRSYLREYNSYENLSLVNGQES